MSKDKDKNKHHTRNGELARPEDDQQEIWCPNVQKWMTRAEHQARFAPPGDEGRR